MRLPKLVFIAFIVFTNQVAAERSLATLHELQSASLLVVDHNNAVQYSKNPDQLLIPASTVKLLTALIALEHWGPQHRFKTGFYIDTATNILWVQGLGDPYLISEELDLIAEKLHGLGIRYLQGIGVDAHFFGADLHFDGGGDTDNPYDASASALAANFNTVKIRVRNGDVRSGESQTPLTHLARKIGSNLSNGTHRVNLGQSQRSPQYFAELLAAKLAELGVIIGSTVVHDLLPTGSKLLFEHLNSRDLERVAAAMLEYSNNFIANQLYLLLGVEHYGTPVALDKSRRVFTEYIDRHFQWISYSLRDGSGLSRSNQLSARQLVDILQAFSAYRHIMPVQSKNIRAKTGTLKRISTYAGYLHRDHEWSVFALMINQPVDYFFRERLAEELLVY